VTFRSATGFDAHRLGGDPPLVLGGVVVDEHRGVVATSDGDVAAHAVIDALLGVAGLGDLGEHFPSSDPLWHGASSIGMLRTAGEMAASWVRVVFVDLTIVAETVRVAPHRREIAEGIAAALGLDPALVSVKATSTDGLGFTGRGEGVAALAIVSAEAAPYDARP
jgi:2-C-methyl-D-erythritol 4-phosphate cytidylyltransferase / 2-C-methyl-D-erythritol 2,4-cyclodiphosphate synthase